MKSKDTITLDVNNLNEDQIGILENALMRGLAKEIQDNESLRGIIGGDNALWIEAGWDNGNSWIEAGWDNSGKVGIINQEDLVTQIADVEVSNVRPVVAKIDTVKKVISINRFKKVRTK